MIICLEGINGSGKTALIAAIREKYPERRVVSVDPSQNSAFGSSVRRAIMGLTVENDGAIDPNVEALAFAAARLQGAARLSAGLFGDELVIVERWSGAVRAYGAADGAHAPLIDVVANYLADMLPFDATVLLDLPGRVAEVRLAGDDRNRFEDRGAEYLDRVRGTYLHWARDSNTPVVDSDRPLEVVLASVTAILGLHD